MGGPSILNHRFSCWKRVAVIGGGPAGSAAAIRLRQHGIGVTLFERSLFPREKTCGCCLAGTGLQALDELGCLAPVQSHARPLQRWLGSIDGHSTVVPLTDHLAISRAKLDSILLRHARRLGAEIRQPSTAEISSMDESSVVLETPDPRNGCRHESFDGVVLATGLSASGAQDWLPISSAPKGPFGVCFHMDHQGWFPSDAIGMVCDGDGYVGMVGLENGRLVIAAALQAGRQAASRGTPWERTQAILAKARWPTGFDREAILDRQSSVCVGTTPRLRRRRLAGIQRIMAVGDAAGYEEPFTGEGITWAMIGGLGAADWIASAPVSPADVGNAWPFQMRRLLRREMNRCRWISSALRHGVSRRLMGSALATFPWMSRPFVRALHRRPRFDATPLHPSAKPPTSSMDLHQGQT